MVLVLPLVLSACVGSSGGPSASSAAPSDPPHLAAGEFPEGGAIEGRVFDDEAKPLSGAQVSIVSPSLSVLTGAEGEFRFRALAPGTYRLGAQALGHEVGARSVTVEAGQTAKVVFSLRPLAVNVAYQETFGPFQGYFECQASLGHAISYGDCVGLGRLPYHSANDKTVFNYRLTGNDLQTMMAQARWTKASAATGDRMYFEIDNSIPGRAYNPSCWGDGASPVTLRWELPDNGNAPKCSQRYFPDGPNLKLNRTFYVEGSVPFADAEVLYQQHFEVMVSAWYVEAAPKDVDLFPAD
jgi:hypothetical protein